MDKIINHYKSEFEEKYSGVGNWEFEREAFDDYHVDLISLLNPMSKEERGRFYDRVWITIKEEVPNVREPYDDDYELTLDDNDPGKQIAFVLIDLRFAEYGSSYRKTLYNRIVKMI